MKSERARKYVEGTVEEVHARHRAVDIDELKDYLTRAVEIAESDIPKRVVERWTSTDLAYLRENYASMSNSELAVQLKRSNKAIAEMGHRLHLLKDADHSRGCYGRPPKPKAAKRAPSRRYHLRSHSKPLAPPPMTSHPSLQRSPTFADKDAELDYILAEINRSNNDIHYKPRI